MLLESPVRKVKRLRVDNRRTRILTGAEQRRSTGRLSAEVPGDRHAGADHRRPHRRAPGAPLGGLRRGRPDVPADEERQGEADRHHAVIQAVLDQLPKASPWLFTNRKTQRRLHRQRRAPRLRSRGRSRRPRRADITLHTLRHTALSRMIAAGFDDYTVMAISGHSSTRMLARYTHPTEERKYGALETFGSDFVGQEMGSTPESASADGSETEETARDFGGRRGDRTPDLCIANAALSQLS